jgi:hypothetical protein
MNASGSEMTGEELWKLLLDTDIAEGSPRYAGKSGDTYGVTARSLLLLVRADQGKAACLPGAPLALKRLRARCAD